MSLLSLLSQGTFPCKCPFCIPPANLLQSPSHLVLASRPAFTPFTLRGARVHRWLRAVLCCVRGRRYSFACVDYLVTNFHQPQSTLLLLVAALLGGQPATLHAVYNHALDGGYRFLSYGDCMLIARM